MAGAPPVAATPIKKSPTLNLFGGGASTAVPKPSQEVDTASAKKQAAEEKKAAAAAQAKARQQAAEERKAAAAAQAEAQRQAAEEKQAAAAAAAEARRQAAEERKAAAAAQAEARRQAAEEKKAAAAAQAEARRQAAEERKAKQQALASKAESAVDAMDKSSSKGTFSLFGLIGQNSSDDDGSPAPAAPKRQPVRAASKSAPRGVPTLERWRQNRNGSIAGYIKGSSSFSDGEFVTTSPIVNDAIGGTVVQTASGSR